MRELNAYQQDVIARLRCEGRGVLARKVYEGWMRGVNEHIPDSPPRLRAPRRRGNLTSARLAVAA